MPVSTFAKVVGSALVVVAVAAVVFAVMSGCEKAPAPKGPTPVTVKSGSGAASAVVAPTSAAGPANATAAPAQVAAAAPATGAGAAAAAATQAGGYPVSGPDGDQTKIEVGGLTMPKPVT